MPTAQKPMRRRMTKAEILATASKIFGSSIKWINWLGTPKDHRFVTQCESNISFTGADFFAKFKTYNLDVFVWYREKVTDADYETEQKFEDSVREMGNFTKECGYNNADNLFYSHYVFELKEEMPSF